MHLNIQQEVFSIGDRFDVRDAQGNVCYQVEGEIFTFTPTLHIYDTAGRECAYVQQKLWNFLPTYEICVGGHTLVTLQRQIAFFEVHYEVPELGWRIAGDFLQHEYSIDAPWGCAASISRQWFTWGDCYDLFIAQPKDALTALCLCLAVDLDRARSARNHN